MFGEVNAACVRIDPHSQADDNESCHLPPIDHSPRGRSASYSPRNRSQIVLARVADNAPLEPADRPCRHRWRDTADSLLADASGPRRVGKRRRSNDLASSADETAAHNLSAGKDANQVAQSALDSNRSRRKLKMGPRGASTPCRSSLVTLRITSWRDVSFN